MSKPGLSVLLASIAFLPLVTSHVVHADPVQAPAEDKTLSPFFVVDGAQPGVEALPLESTRADVHIAGVISDVTVTQTYRNDGDRTISAKYVFPASTRAAVYAMKMTIGDRVIVAKIKEREEAKHEYDEAKAAGKTATLLEEERPNVFTMSVANVLPKDRIQVELKYTELLVPTDGVYEMVYPTVVGPRYASETLSDGKKATGKHGENEFVATPYQHAGATPVTGFAMHVDVHGGMPIQQLESPSHKIASTIAANHDNATVDLDPTETNGGNRDFVLRYRLAGKDLASGLMLYPGDKENFFLAMVQPPQRPAPELIPPREYVFIVDVSGSMQGFPLQTTKALMKDLLGRLRPTDKFDVLLFSGDDALYSEKSVDATADEIKKATAFVDKQNGGGGTELLPAIQHAMKLPRAFDNVSRSFVVVTDGFIAEEPAVFDQIRDHLGEANVWSFGIGTSVNRHLMDGIAKAGQGEAFTILGPDQAAAAAAKFRAYVETPVLTNVKVAFDGLAAYDVEPKVLPDVFASRPVIVFGKYKGAPTGKVTLTGVSGRGRFVSTLDASLAKPDAANSALRYLWARNEISELSDFFNQDKNKDAVTKLGLEYNLLTKFTSFIAVQDVVRTTQGSTNVTQPSAMPAGVTDSAISQSESMEVGAEPPFAWLIVIVAGIAVWVGFKARKQAGRAGSSS
ncbi:MAG TPA: VIT and VWA domain-containing protein [Kofleriaceae bacterium]|nr:VIT and VWA domain-containing protein [Kofleriaceae bacterium]